MGPIQAGITANEQPLRDQIHLIGHQASREAHELRTFLLRNQIPFEWIDVDTNVLARFLTNGITPVPHTWPVCLFPDGSFLEAPSRIELARKLGLHTKPDQPEYDLAIMGAGPAGLTAAVYAASEGLRTIVIEREAPGGQAGSTSRIENYPGFPDGISGIDLVERARRQAQRFGTEFVLVNEVVSINPYKRAPFEYYLLDGTSLRCYTTIVATGASYRLLDAPGIKPLIGRGVFYGTAMSEAVAYSGGDVFVVGGGNSAGQTALHLSQYARTVTLLVRADSLKRSMSQYLIDQLEATANIEIALGSEIVRAEGDSRLERLIIKRGSLEVEHEANALFILIGQRPATDWAEGVLQMDSRGFIVTGEKVYESDAGKQVLELLGRPLLPLETAAPGVFAAGDVRHGSVNRVAWAVGEAAMAVQLIHKYLDSYLERDFKVLKEVMEQHFAEHSHPDRIDLPNRRPD